MNREIAFVFFVIVYLLAVVIMACILHVAAALAHEAPQGWAYDQLCCSGKDCAMVKPEAVTEEAQGYVIRLKAGEHPMVTIGDFADVIPYGDKRIKDSPDGEYHLFNREGILSAN